MKTALRLTGLFLIALVIGAAALAQSAPTTLTLNWTNNDSAWGPTCPTTAPKSCLSSITAEDITSLTPVILSAAVAFNATTFTYTYPATPSYGNHTYAVFATGFDATGNAVKSAPTSVVVDVEPKLNPVTVLTATYQ